MEKTAGVRVWQLEINDRLGVCAKLLGSPADVAASLAAGHRVAEQMGGRPVSQVINRPADSAQPAIASPPEYNPLIQQDVVHVASPEGGQQSDEKENNLGSSSSFALGLIETQGFTAVFEAIDTACKAANVEVVGKEKLGGGYVTVVIKGDVAAVKAAIDAGRPKVEALGTLIAAHVIPRPSPSVLRLLPQS